MPPARRSSIRPWTRASRVLRGTRGLSEARRPNEREKYGHGGEERQPSDRGRVAIRPRIIGLERSRRLIPAGFRGHAPSSMLVSVRDLARSGARARSPRCRVRPLPSRRTTEKRRPPSRREQANQSARISPLNIGSALPAADATAAAFLAPRCVATSRAGREQLPPPACGCHSSSGATNPKKVLTAGLQGYQARAVHASTRRWTTAGRVAGGTATSGAIRRCWRTGPPPATQEDPAARGRATARGLPTSPGSAAPRASRCRSS